MTNNYTVEGRGELFTTGEPEDEAGQSILDDLAITEGVLSVKSPHGETLLFADGKAYSKALKRQEKAFNISKTENAVIERTRNFVSGAEKLKYILHHLITNYDALRGNIQAMLERPGTNENPGVVTKLFFINLETGHTILDTIDTDITILVEQMIAGGLNPLESDDIDFFISSFEEYKEHEPHEFIHDVQDDQAQEVATKAEIRLKGIEKWQTIQSYLKSRYPAIYKRLDFSTDSPGSGEDGTKTNWIIFRHPQTGEVVYKTMDSDVITLVREMYREKLDPFSEADFLQFTHTGNESE